MASNAACASTIIRFQQSKEQTVGEIRKVVGLVKVRQLVGVIDALDLDANPRASKIGPVTREIQESLEETPDLFPFKTKGVLLGTSRYEKYSQRERYRLYFEDPKTEGILDGGHNMLAIGLTVLECSLGYAGIDLPKSKIATWDSFKRAWVDNRQLITDYMAKTADTTGAALDVDPLNAFVPVELIVPADPNDPIGVGEFKTNLLAICAARNNNVQLTLSTKANKRGDFDSLKRIIRKKDPELEAKIEWKTNAGGSIKVEDIITLAWIPLSLLDGLTDEDGGPLKPPSPVTLYSGKATALAKYEKLMDSDEITVSTGNDYLRELKSVEVESALQVTADIPELYDYIYSSFRDLYNAAGGRYGSINAIVELNKKYKVKRTPFGHGETEIMSPDGYIAPYVYGLVELLEITNDGNGHQLVGWRKDVGDPKEWLERNLGKVVKRCWKDVIPWNYDPVRYGKAKQSYEHVREAYLMTRMGL